MSKLIIAKKKCSKCGEIKKLSEFSKMRNGLRSHCKACCAAYHQIWREAHPDYQRIYREAHPDYVRAHYKKHPEQYAAHDLAYRKTHRKQCADYNRAWCNANPEKIRSRNQRRRAQKRGVDLKKFDDIEIFERDSWICQICGKKIDKRIKWPSPKSKSLDHIVPLLRGGSHVRQNVQATHLRCNISKSAKGGGQLKLIG